MKPESATYTPVFFLESSPFQARSCGMFQWFLDLCVSTFAISLQLFPASLIVLSLCSSAGVHGVFVRLFFLGSGG